jgi:hypothetical protein
MEMNKFITLDIRVSRTQKEYFEQAAEIGGFQSLTDFLLTAASEKEFNKNDFPLPVAPTTTACPTSSTWSAKSNSV